MTELPPDNIGDDTLANDAQHIDELYESWFLEYASYVILDRAVPYLEDGLKPVQRRILHAMKLLDDGRYHKVANIIGKTMTFHPHGDASIADALVNLGQKDLLIDTQGNWGNIFTGDPAAAPRYIEARLSKFALEVLFHPELTEWQASYDGRAKEPVMLPVRFPLLLAQGVEGIAVGLSTRILPHNFLELINASIAVLEGRPFKLYPDFPTGGMIDVSQYNKGARGGRIKVRARIETVDAKTLRICDIPYGTTTTSLIDSIVAANEKGNIRIRKIEDNTAREVDVRIHLPSGVSPEVTIDALYAFTNCEVSISPNCCIIYNGRPLFTDVHELLKISTEHTKHLLERELQIRLEKLEQKWHAASLEKIFIENRIYRDIEECETWESVLETIDRGLEPHKHKLRREVTEDDIVRLTEIKIKRISKYDSFRADTYLAELEKDIAQVKLDLQHMTEYTIAWFEGLRERYGKGRERRTKIQTFEQVDTVAVAAATEKLYVDRAEGFIGTGLKKAELIGECSALDDVIAIRKDGKFTVSKVGDKVFMGKDILHAAVWRKGDERTVYNMIYRDGRQGPVRAKRFTIPSVIRDREYDLTKGNPGSRVLYLTANPQGEAEVVQVTLREDCRAKKKQFEFDFGDIDIRGRGSHGNIVTKYPVRRITQLSVGPSTLAPESIWFDPATGRLNTEERGRLLGEFGGDDRIVALYDNGEFEVTDFNPDNRYGDGLLLLEKRPAHGILTLAYQHPERDADYVKRIELPVEPTGKRVALLPEGAGKVLFASLDARPRIRAEFRKGKRKTPEPQELVLEDIVGVKGLTAIGNKLARHRVKKIVPLDPLPEPEPQATPGDAPAADSESPSRDDDTPTPNNTGSLTQLSLLDPE
ncbi:MAG: DNA gyrase/topoisomerase IV subunit A [Candidatus Dadabacteria bacterium]|nr:MAG: DNA gyrase/topoisomerase IV subunit A [Candidatus Dadabacteria bacterium]